MVTFEKENKVKAHHLPLKLMGCGFVLTAVHRDPQVAWDGIRAAQSEIERIEHLISSWQSNSQTTMINDNAGIRPVVVEKELLQLILRSIKISDLTSGAFDICGTLSRYYWNFDGKENPQLSDARIRELKKLMNYRLIEVDTDASTVYLPIKGMKIGFGGIGKGYAADRAMKVMQAHGIKSGLINASGDLQSWGTPPNGGLWDIKIIDPAYREKSLVQFSIPNGSVVSSGNYENYCYIDGVRYSHIVDPRTGWPVKSIKNVSVVSPCAEFADAMATAISVMGMNEGINIINKLNGIECIIIDDNDNAHYSNHLKTFELCEN